uniref:Uncharacterized protein n=1 Tax=Ananas comosus var. bracteatus TaxID=296719 RepID=A0A6V7QDH1_ANACO|nr:unnamed protein product [Ananas comosus var. bracteatus]
MLKVPSILAHGSMNWVVLPLSISVGDCSYRHPFGFGGRMLGDIIQNDDMMILKVLERSYKGRQRDAALKQPLGEVIAWRSMLSASWIHGETGLAEVAADHLSLLEVHGGSYILLLNTYENNARRLRKTMRDRGFPEGEVAAPLSLVGSYDCRLLSASHGIITMVIDRTTAFNWCKETLLQMLLLDLNGDLMKATSHKLTLMFTGTNEQPMNALHNCWGDTLEDTMGASV